MKKILSVVLLTTIGFAANVNVVPYGGFIGYSKNTVKDKAYLGGLYAGYFNFPYKVEIDGEFLQIKYNDSTPDYYERDLTFVGSYFMGSNYKVKLGIRNMFIDQKNNSDDYDKAFIGGVLYYKYMKYNIGVDYYYSTYDNFHVNQITPHFGFNFGDYYSDEGSFYFNADINIIKISDQYIAGTKDDTYVNTDLMLSNFKGPWTTTLKASLGKFAYKVAKGGYVVYNLGEEYHYSFGVDVNYKINKKSALTLGYSRSRFEENDKKAYSNVYTASFSYNF